jgi:hypothetical protein
MSERCILTIDTFLRYKRENIRCTRQVVCSLGFYLGLRKLPVNNQVQFKLQQVPLRRYRLCLRYWHPL